VASGPRHSKRLGLIRHATRQLFQLSALKDSDHLPLGRRFEDISECKFTSLGICGVKNAVGSLLKIIIRVPQLNRGTKHQPVSAWFPKRHTDAPGVHDASGSDHSLKLHVGMTTNNNGNFKRFEDRNEEIVRRGTNKDLCIVAGCCVAEQDFTETRYLGALRGGPAGEQVPIFDLKMLSAPADRLPLLFRSVSIPMRLDSGHLGQNLPVSVAKDKPGRDVQIEKQPDGFAGKRAGENITADHNRIWARTTDFLQNGFQCRRIGVDVVNGGYGQVPFPPSGQLRSREQKQYISILKPLRFTQADDVRPLVLSQTVEPAADLD
jgi:hypothetical protein